MQVTDAEDRLVDEHPERAAPQIQPDYPGDVDITVTVGPDRAHSGEDGGGQERHQAARAAADAPIRPRTERRIANTTTTASAPKYEDLLNE